ncbi:MAG: Holliday junction resolvase RuvX [Candidatus Omnitrophica bacterium]|nr:Holliday junction resolvase RuvX [Candidatus Omnitrophota bacterium]MDD5487461.1 Holliday junction resolvase RuvX [Candidatus Omnitrophota bacterium]
MRVMGLDIGMKHIGVAVSDESGTIAQGRGVVERRTDRDAVSRIKELADEYGVKEIVVGFPINMNGTVGERGRDSEVLAEKIKEATGLNVVLWDERLTTRGAESVLISADVSRRKRKKVVDKIAAQLILQEYLDSMEK